MNFVKTGLGLAFALFFAAVAAHAEGKKISVYNLTDTTYSFHAFTEKTGVAVEVLQGDSIDEIGKRSGYATHPDLIIQDDALEFLTLKNQGFLLPISSSVIEQNIPAQFRDLEAGWVGMAFRGRILAYNPNVYTPPEQIRYEDLGQPEFKNKLCLRDSSYSFSRGLLASLILADGYDASVSIVKGWVENLGQSIFDRDLHAVQALEAGQCGLVFVNSDFFAKYVSKSPTKLKAVWPNQADRGTHVNLIAMGLSIETLQPELATELLNFVAADEASHLDFGSHRQAFPTNLKFFDQSDAGKRFGHVKWDPAPISKILDLDDRTPFLAYDAGY